MAKKGFVELLKDIFKPAPGPSVADKKMDRRRFFRAGLAELMKPLDAAVRPLEQVAREVAKLEEPWPPPRKYTTPTYDQPWLRPPGALPEGEFRSRCTRSGDCVRACPVQAIQIDGLAEKGGGYPYIEPSTQACVVCASLACMHVCPSGALQPVPRYDIDMGTAEWFSDTCVRTHGQECTLCVEKCPVGAVAIELQEGKVVVHPDGCTGCGTCQQVCPTDPKSIIVMPKSAR